MAVSNAWSLLQQEIDQLLAARSPRTQLRVRQLVSQCDAQLLPPPSSHLGSHATLISGGIIQTMPDAVWCLDAMRPTSQHPKHVVIGCLDGSCSVVELRGPLAPGVASVAGPSPVVETFMSPTLAAVVAVAAAPRHAAVALGCGNGCVYLWTLAGDERLSRHHDGHSVEGNSFSGEKPGPGLLFEAHHTDEDLQRYFAALTPLAEGKRCRSIDSMIVDDDAEDDSGGSDVSSMDESKNSTSSMADLDDECRAPLSSEPRHSRHSTETLADVAMVRATPITSTPVAGSSPAQVSRQSHGPSVLLMTSRDCVTALSWLDSNALLCGMRSGCLGKVDINGHGRDICQQVLLRVSQETPAPLGPITRIAPSPHSAVSSILVCVGTASGTAVLADTRTAGPIDALPSVVLPGKSSGRCLRDIAFSASSEHVFWTGGDDRQLKTWDLRKLAAPTNQIEHGHAIRSIAHVAASGGGNGWLVVTQADDLITVSPVDAGGRRGRPALEFKDLHQRKMLSASCTAQQERGLTSIVTGCIAGRVSQLVVQV
jgi:hypothetical protein